MTSVAVDAAPSERGRQIPIVCPGHTRPLAELQFVHIAEEQRTFLLSACHDKMPMMRDGASGDWIGTWQGHKGAVWSCQMDASGSLAATASGDFSARVWDAITGETLFELPHKHIVKTCVFSPDSKRLATGGKEGTLRIYDLKQALSKQINPGVELKLPSKISKICWMSDSVLLCGMENGNVSVFEIPEVAMAAAPPLKPTHTLTTAEGEEVRDMELCKITSGQTILTVAAGTKVFFFDMATHEMLHAHKVPVHFRDEGGASLHPSGTKFVSGGSDLWVRVFDFADGQVLECHKGHHGPIRCVRYSPDGLIYATGSEDGTIRLWKTDPEKI